LGLLGLLGCWVVGFVGFIGLVDLVEFASLLPGGNFTGWRFVSFLEVVVGGVFICKKFRSEDWPQTHTDTHRYPHQVATLGGGAYSERTFVENAGDCRLLHVTTLYDNFNCNAEGIRLVTQWNIAI
jgi:hypothetical protein